jgi:sulfide dehydrogenase cytochrome subunit
MKQKAIASLSACSSLVGIVLCGLLFAPSAGAADVAKLADTCAGCHGKDGVSHESDVPIIASYSAQYVSDTLTAYQNKERPCPVTKIRDGDKKGKETDMCRVAKDLSAADIAELGKYFAAKKFVPAQQSFDAALAKKGAKLHEVHCEKCHSENGSQPSDDSGILAGQWMPYLKEQFKDFTSGKRPMEKKMKPKIEKLEPGDFDALVNYYGSLK